MEENIISAARLEQCSLGDVGGEDSLLWSLTNVFQSCMIHKLIRDFDEMVSIDPS
jgi:hypothetical protein